MTTSAILSAKYQRPQLLPPEQRITHTMGAALLSANKTRNKSAWVSRTVANRLAALGLTMFRDYNTTGRGKSKRIQVLIQLTGAGREKARDI